ncbi:hypothetical protein GPECTOR_1260g517 [Gonium pectorale]|uniref:ODAD1 central coiled coil region domain-containing protein n=1 Tax=Gonium pectorale TaxID=33097 RepID=A0A150FTK0_GONPE|nr:hypothetical protein GPECTOR_1260g517 [Gonium pectorale]|eukprot:KXZ40929.1 hypothetical protein GPECTOR_1260g517 [Gonium pectorale]
MAPAQAGSQAQAARLTKVLEGAEAAEEYEEAAGASPRSGGASSPASPVPLDLDSVEQGVGAEAAAMQLQRTAGLPSLPATLSHYSCLEQRSFDLFNSCNEANERITALTKEARELEAELRQLESAAVSGRQHEAIRGVLGRRDTALRRAESCAERRSQLDRRLAQLRAGIHACLRKLGAAAAAQAWEASAPSAATAGTAPPEAGGGAASTVPPAQHPAAAACAHVMAGLALLEQRAAAVVAVQGTMVGRTSSLQRGGGVTVGRLPSATTPSPRGRAAAVGSKAAGGRGPAPPPAEDPDSEDEEDEMPLTREQIQARSSSLRRA